MAMSVTRPAGLAEAVSLAELCTLGVGGPTRYYVRAGSAEAAAQAAAWASAEGLPLLILGGGSNLVVSDDGFPGLALHLLVRGVDAVEADGSVELTAGAGEPWDPLVERAVAAGWAGVECLSGIPGFVGATPLQNVGAYGQDVSETITRVRALDLHSGAVQGVQAPTLADTRRAVIDVRRGKSMVIDPDDPNRRSVGSFFMNPVVSADEAGRIEADLGASGTLAASDRMPAFPAGDGRTKLS